MTGNTLEVETGVPVTVTVGLEELYPGPRTCRDTRCEEQGQCVRTSTREKGEGLGQERSSTGSGRVYKIEIEEAIQKKG